ncbi:ABC transporter permease [Planctomyces sp. SH-PL14]|uniref:ABC transporter permease n=1 Tax=Planctomyces sp. SH-PL14 TaxID=1632864 RepID=UPI0009EEB532|nr:ABC transporter permease [Planctomyces sp. SH-PL14]
MTEKGGVRFTGGGAPGGAFNRGPTLVGTDAVEAPYTLLEGRWLDPKQADALDAVISKDAASQLKVTVGDEVNVSPGGGFGFGGSAGETANLTIVGIVEQRKTLPTTPAIVGLPAMRAAPVIRGPASAALYVPVNLASKIAGVEPTFEYVGLALKKGYGIDEFQRNWAGRLSQAKPAAYMQSLAELDAELSESTTSDTVRSQAYAATGISLLAALFIVFSTLSMGVDERIRQFAILRAVTLTKWQVAAMIGLESLLLGLVGWCGGLLAGWGLLQLIVSWKPDLFPIGAFLGFWCVFLSGLCAVGGALAAAIMPAWRATRVHPLEAMAPQPKLPMSRASSFASAVGLVLVAVNPLLVFWIPMADTSRYMMSAAVGCTAMAIGFILLAPAVVLITERFLGPVLARLLGVAPQLLATQLSTNLWRTLGTTIGLTLGLGLFVAMQTWGSSMLGPYTPGDWVPDMLVALSPSGLPDSAVKAVLDVPGVDSNGSLPCVAEQTRFATDVTGAKVRATASRQDNCVMVGVDADRGIGGDDPVFPFHFVKGSAKEAAAKLKEGRYCLVPDHFERESGLTIGGKFGVVPPEAKDEVIEYEIAGIVSMDGWHWMSKIGLRNRGGGRSAGLMFADFAQVQRDFGIKRTSLFWLNTDGTATEEEIKKSIQSIAEANYDPSAVRRGGFGGAGGFGGMMGGRGNGGSATSVNIRTREGVREAIRERAAGIIWLLSRLPLVTLLVTSLGVVNAIVSSVRARRWDLGILRAVGLTRSGLFRLVLCEAILVGLAACLLSFGFGVMAGYCGTGITRYVNIRGGLVTPLIIPWSSIAAGFGLTLALCLAAALWPAIQAGRTEPLKLLQAGRSAM